MEDFRIRRFGFSGLLIEFAEVQNSDSLCRCRGIMRCLTDTQLEDLTDLTPAGTSLLLEFGSRRSAAVAMRPLRALLQAAVPEPPEMAPLHEISVCYDGIDLEDVAVRTGLSVAEVIELHASPVYNVFMIGFSPGFPYLGPIDARLRLARLTSPRPRVPEGSVAIGDRHTGIYTIPSAGGWHIIGHTNLRLFQRKKARGKGSPQAFMLRQGDRVKFRPTP